MPEIEAYKPYNTPALCVAAKNIPEFYALIEKAKEQSEALRETVNKLSCFYFDLEVSVNREKQSGEMVEASTITKVIPTK